MFCEEIDSTVHLNAEENLNKIIRYCEKTFIVRIQYDVYHEIKKNGNERSLRICLNIFGCYCHLIKQRKVKPYATNFLPCIYAISKRKETQLIESLADFLKIFCKFMENCLSDRDVLKLVEVSNMRNVPLKCLRRSVCRICNFDLRYSSMTLHQIVLLKDVVPHRMS